MLLLVDYFLPLFYLPENVDEFVLLVLLQNAGMFFVH